MVGGGDMAGELLAGCGLAGGLGRLGGVFLFGFPTRAIVRGAGGGGLGGDATGEVVN